MAYAPSQNTFGLRNDTYRESVYGCLLMVIRCREDELTQVRSCFPPEPENKKGQEKSCALGGALVHVP